MSEQQNAYLKAMGIDVWLERMPSIPDTPIQQNKTEPVIPAHVPVQEFMPEPEVKNSIEDIDSLDWSGLLSTVTECQRCDLSKIRTKAIFGEGRQTASLMIIGDAPSVGDEQQGSPFSGKSGMLLTAMLKAIGYQRNDVYITTLVKCRTNNNQEPSVEEVATCESYLKRQINLLKPNLILALGSITAQRLLKSKSTLGRLRGQLHYVEGINVPVIVSFDPAYLLRSQNEKRKAWEDLQMVMKELSTSDDTRAASASFAETNE